MKEQNSRYEGYEIGETCNRDGCTGIVKERVKEGSCSCHIEYKPTHWQPIPSPPKSK